MKQKLLLLLLIVLAVPVTMMADDPVEIGGIYYNLIPKGKIASVTSNPNKYTDDVVIPSTVEFEGVTYTVKEIGSSAFANCTGLTSIEIPNSVTSIGGSAFSGCSGLTSIEIPNSVTSIGGSAFSGCSGLTSIEIPNSVTSISDGTFWACSGLTSIDIPNCVTSIGYSAFSGCSSLISIDIPNSVTSIGTDAFSGCSSLASITVESGNTVYDSRDNSNAIIETSSNTLTNGCKNTVIPSSVTSIGYSAFSGCSSLISIDIPNSVTSIGSDAFKNCSGLISIGIPNSVTSIGSYAFYGCSSLTSIDIPDGVTSIGSYAFYGCSSLTSIDIPENLTTIRGSTFENCSYLTSIIIPEGVTSIEGNAFRGCSGLTSIVLPNSLVDASGLNDCYPTYFEYHCRLEQFFNNKNYSDYNFYGPEISNIETLVIGDEIDHVGGTTVRVVCFRNNDNLKNVTIGSGVTNIVNCFNNCKNLDVVTCYATTPPVASSSFDGSYIEYATLIVPDEAYNAYSTTLPWSNFGTIKKFSEYYPAAISLDTPANGSISATVDGAAVSSGDNIGYNRTVILSNSPDLGYVFDHYTVTAADGTEVPVTDGSFTMPSQDVTVSAVFREAAINTVTINNQEGGVLCVMQGNTEITSGTNVMEGTILTISHTPADGYVLDHYTVTDGNGVEIPLDETNSFAMPDTPVVIDVAYKGSYEIASLEDLVALANYVNEGNPTLGLRWIQTADIDISSISAWKPIGVGEHNAYYNGPSTLSSEGFAGTYDGQGHVITGANLSDSESEAVGIFGIVTGTVKRLGVTGANYNATKDCRGGALAGVVAASSNSTGLVENCFVTNSSIKTASRVGGALAGAVYGGVVSNCYTANNTVTGARYGYVTGDTRSDKSYKGTVQYCYTNGGSVTSSQSGITTSCQTNVSAERFASGEIAYLLNGSSSTSPTWYQTIGSDNYPTLIESDGNTVSCEHRFSCTNTDLGINYNNNGKEGNATEHMFTLVPANFDSESDLAYNKCVYCGQIFAMDADPTANPQALDNIPPITASYGDTFTLPSTITEGQTITWTSNDTDIANISDNTLTITSVGTATITATIDGGTSFDAVTQDYNLTANKAPLTITVKDHAIVIGETLPTTYEVEYSGFKNGDDASVLTAQPTFSCSATSDSGIGTYDIIASGAEADNYEITYVNGTLTIDAAIATITIPAEGMTTYSLNHDLDFSGVTDFKAYIIVGYNKKTNKVIAVEVDEAPAGTGLYLAGTPGSYEVPLGESGTYYMNMLKGVTTATTIPATNGDFANLTLSSATTPTFAPASDGSSVDANTAYLQIETAKYNGQPIELLLMDKELLGDINKDGNVTIVDVMMVVDIILNQ